jgi:predicted alpha/beta-hydrolase family hydrolase
VERFSFASRGDTVEGRLWCPPALARHPLVLITPGVGASAALPTLTSLGERLQSAGVAAACFDLPLQGQRASRKLSERLEQAAKSAAPSRAEAQLYAAFAGQVAADLSAARWAERAGGVRLARCEVANAHAAIERLTRALLG